MEKKTMGSFMAALRKAQGMTQRELAERLNVSDKSVSRWECDDGYPDVSMLPVIAEIFGVTVDELLRGERKTEKNREEGSPAVGGDRKSSKELKRLRDMTLSSFRSGSILAIGIAFLGVLVAAVLNIGILRGPLGFLVGCLFLFASLILEAISINGVLSKDYGEVDDGTVVNTTIHFAEITLSADFVLLGFLLPLIVFVSDTYQGLSGGSWLLYGGIFASAALVLSAVIVHFLNGMLVQKGTITLSGERKVRYQKIHHLNTLSGVVFACLLLVTIFTHVSRTELWGPYSVMKGTVFNDLDSFVSFMEEDVPENPSWFQGPAVPVGEALLEEDVVYFDEYGNVVSKEEAWRRTLVDEDGNEILTYVQRNRGVLSVSWSPKDGSVLPITVYTYDDYRAGLQIIRERNLIFGFVYGIELLLAAILYGFFRRRIK